MLCFQYYFTAYFLLYLIHTCIHPFLIPLTWKPCTAVGTNTQRSREWREQTTRWKGQMLCLHPHPQWSMQDWPKYSETGQQHGLQNDNKQNEIQQKGANKWFMLVKYYKVDYVWLLNTSNPIQLAFLPFIRLLCKILECCWILNHSD